MPIHENNIEAYLLDYLEGNLNPMLSAELMAFLAENPGYEKRLPEYDGRLCIADGTSFENKFLLKKDFMDIPEINGDNFQEFCIASAEKLLPATDECRLQDYLTLHPEKQPEYRLFHQLKLQADTSLTYPGKAMLKKQVRSVFPVRFIYYALGAAASVALMLLFTSRKPPVKDNSVVASSLPPAVNRDKLTSLPAITLYVPPGKPEVKTRQQRYTRATARPSGTAPVALETHTPDLLPLTALQPVRESLMVQDQKIPEMRRISHSRFYSTSEKNIPAPRESEPSTMQFLGTVMKKLNFWRAAETAVSGFNYLTESQISLSKITDENGKLTGLGLATEQFIISGNKIK